MAYLIADDIDLGANGNLTNLPLTSGSILFYDGSKITQNNSNLFWDNTNKYLGIGTNTPSFHIHNESDNDVNAMFSSSGNFSATILGRSFGGTLASPTATVNNAALLFLGARGYNSSAFTTISSASIVMAAAETWTATANGSYVSISTTAIGSITRLERFRINDAGNITVGVWNATLIGVTYGGTGTSTQFTTGSVVFAGALGVYSQNNANYFWDNTNFRLGIGTNIPLGSVEVVGTASPQEIYISRYSTDALTGGFIVRKARGTVDSPSAILSNDTIGTFGGRGYGATGFSSANKASISFFASENWSDTAQGTNITFNTTTIGTTTRTVVATLDNTGFKGVSAYNGLIITANTGVITTGTWNATKLSEAYGGTNQSTYNTGDILYASASNVLSKLAIGTTGQLLKVAGGIPTWASSSNSASNILATVTGISGISAASTTLYTVTTGKTCVVTGIVIRLTSITGSGNGPKVSVGTNSTPFNNIMANTNLNTYGSTTDVFMYSSGGVYHAGQSTEVIKLIVNTVSTHTTWVFSVDLIGYEY